MLKPNHITRKLGSSKYNYYKCSECDEQASHSSGKRSSDGIGYNMKCLCDKHQKEFEKTLKK